MSRIWYKNALVYTEDFAFEFKDFAVEDGKIAEIGTAPQDAEAVDCAGKYIIPGLVDLHGHGNSGEDFSIADLDGHRSSTGVQTVFDRRCTRNRGSASLYRGG